MAPRPPQSALGSRPAPAAFVPYLHAHEGRSAWTPPAEVRLHNGDLIPPNMDFFEPPPEEIGPVLTAYSTLRIGQPVLSWWKKPGVVFLSALITGVAVGGIAFLADGHFRNLANVLSLAFSVSLFVGVPVGFVLLFFINFQHTVTYVGDVGVAKIVIKKKRGQVKKREVFLFAEAADLFVSQVRHYHNGLYSGTRYRFVWKDTAGKRAFRLNGSYYSSKGTPKARSPFYFALSAERAWSMLLLGVVSHEIETVGGIHFRVNKKNTVLVGPGFIEFHFGGKEQRITVAEIGKITLGSGTFHIHHKDARWFSGQGKFSFAYGGMANAKLFLLCLEKFCGGYRLA